MKSTHLTDITEKKVFFQKYSHMLVDVHYALNNRCCKISIVSELYCSKIILSTTN